MIRPETSLRFASLLLCGCAHVFGDFEDRPPRSRTTPHGPRRRIVPSRVFFAGDEFDLRVTIRRTTERSIYATANEEEAIATAPGDFDASIAGHVTVIAVEEGALRSMSLRVTDSRWRRAGALSSPTLTAGTQLWIVASSAGVLLDLRADRALSNDGAMFVRGLLQQPLLWAQPTRWFGPLERRRLGEEWLVAREAHTGDGWLGDPSHAERWARLAWVGTVRGQRLMRLESWSDGPLVARPVAGRDRWARRRTTEDLQALLPRDPTLPPARVEQRLRVEMAVPAGARPVGNGPALVVPVTQELFMLDQMSIVTIVEFSSFVRVATS